MSQCREVLAQIHDNQTWGHLDIRKTLSRIKSGFFWPGFKLDVRAYIAGCEHCLKQKGPKKTRKAPMKIQASGYPMERIATDILGELPITESGNKYILVVSDYYTKWVESFPMPNMEASTVAEIIVKEVVTRFGVPNSIHSDQGAQFESELFQEMCALLQINKTRSTPYHPQSDGMGERFNATLASMLTAYANDNHSNWDTSIPFVMMAYRCAEHETTDVSPNRLMLGREVSTPFDLMYELPREAKVNPRSRWV